MVANPHLYNCSLPYHAYCGGTLWLFPGVGGGDPLVGRTFGLLYSFVGGRYGRSPRYPTLVVPTTLPHGCPKQQALDACADVIYLTPVELICCHIFVC